MQESLFDLLCASFKRVSGVAAEFTPECCGAMMAEIAASVKNLNGTTMDEVYSLLELEEYDVLEVWCRLEPSTDDLRCVIQLVEENSLLTPESMTDAWAERHPRPYSVCWN